MPACCSASTTRRRRWPRCKPAQVYQVYLAPADFMQSGELVVIPNQFSPLGRPQQLRLDGVRAGLQPAGRRRSGPPGDVAGRSAPQVALLEPEAASAPVSGFDFGLSFAVMFILFFTITLSSGYMLQSVVKEKENRTAEVLLLSLSPVQLMLGKILGLGLLALLQMGVWLGGGLLLMGQGQSLLGGIAVASLPAGFVADHGALLPAGLPALRLGAGRVGRAGPQPARGLAVHLHPPPAACWCRSCSTAPSSRRPTACWPPCFSLFPLTSPTAMPTRLVAGDVPAWQIAAGPGAAGGHRLRLRPARRPLLPRRHAAVRRRAGLAAVAEGTGKWRMGNWGIGEWLMPEARLCPFTIHPFTIPQLTIDPGISASISPTSVPLAAPAGSSTTKWEPRWMRPKRHGAMARSTWTTSSARLT